MGLAGNGSGGPEGSHSDLRTWSWRGSDGAELGGSESGLGEAATGDLGQREPGQGEPGHGELGRGELARGELGHGELVREELSRVEAMRAEAIRSELRRAAARSGGLGSRQAGMAKHAISGPIDLPLGLHRNPTAQATPPPTTPGESTQAQTTPAPAEPRPQEKEEAPPTNPIPRLDLPVAKEVDEREVSPVEEAPGSRPRWMTPGETPTARTEQVGGVIEPVGAGTTGTSDDVGGDRMPRSGFWGRRGHRRPRTTLTEVTGHGKPPGALVPFTGQIPVQGGAAEERGAQEQDEPARG